MLAQSSHHDILLTTNHTPNAFKHILLNQQPIIHNSITQKNRLWLTTPDLISNSPNQQQLLLHILPLQRIALGMRREPALRTDTDLLERGLAIDTVALGDEVRGLVHALDHVGLVLELWELGRHDAEDDVLVAWEFLQWFETAGAWSVVF